jgi:predicted PP-loop superfamily ATPase
VPANATLSFWHWDCTTDSIDFDWQDAYITDSNGNILQTIFHQCGNCQSWVNQTVESDLVRRPDYPRQVSGASGWLWRPYWHVCGRCAVNLAVRLDLSYACA